MPPENSSSDDNDQTSEDKNRDAPTETNMAADDYSKAEIKQFAKTAAAVRKYDEAKGHSVAVCNFIDTEFSDGTGRLARARSEFRQHPPKSNPLNHTNFVCHQGRPPTGSAFVSTRHANWLPPSWKTGECNAVYHKLPSLTNAYMHSECDSSIPQKSSPRNKKKND